MVQSAATYRIYLLPEHAEKAPQAFKLQEAVNPSILFQREKEFWIGPDGGMFARSFLVSSSEATAATERYLNSLKTAKLITTWELADQPPSFRWVLLAQPRAVTIPNLVGYLHALTQSYHLRVPRVHEPLSLTGVNEGNEKIFFSDEQLEREGDTLIFSLSPGERLFFWARKNKYPEKQETVAVAQLLCTVERTIMIEQQDGICFEFT